MTNKPTRPSTIMSKKDEQPSNRIVKVLGIYWDTGSDNLCFDLEDTLSYSSSLPPTKRSLLKLSAKIFDLLVLSSSSLCIDKCTWDYPLEGKVLDEWNQLLKELKILFCIKVSRYYFNPN